MIQNKEIDLPAAAAMNLAREVFGSLLIGAFVGGSRAIRSHRQNSDIDAFVVISEPDREREVEYALRLGSIHVVSNLSFDHCGEIFDWETLNSLLAFTELMDTMVKHLAESPCYRGNCLLSIYRKGRVVLEFLAGPMLCAVDPHGVLPKLAERSRIHLTSYPTDIPPRDIHVAFVPGTQQAQLFDLWTPTGITSHEMIDTPVGVGLGRWFGQELNARAELLVQSQAPPSTMAQSLLICPLSQLGNSEKSDEPIGYMGVQCLGEDLAELNKEE